ncbi:MAG: family 16 glycoside hydrolase [Sedimentisphaerales bacterium]
MNKSIRYALVLSGLLSICVSVRAAESANPYLGRWALTIPGGSAGWLSVEQKEGYLDASILWGGGSVVPVDFVVVDGENLIVTRNQRIERKDAGGKVVRTQTLTEMIMAKVSGDTMELIQIRPNRNGKGASRSEFTGKRIPPLPPRPDLSGAKFGKPIVLFDGKNLNGWKLTNPDQTNGWSVEDGVLVNKPVQQKGKPHISYGNLRTVVDDFEDFNLKLEVNVPKGGNSGVYLRGIYEVQVSDSYGRNLDSHNMCGVYSRIAPTANAEKPAGQWQTMNITLLDRHVTVELNGKRIIDNQPLLGCTGGALWPDEFRPGPIYLQGDHSGVSYRNIVLTPIIKGQVSREPVIFEDSFEGKLAEGWTWLRENPKTWRISDGGLEICGEPGAAHDVKNALVRKAPDRSKGKWCFEVTVTNHTVPTQQYEQAGITWYNNGKPVFKLVKELVSGELMIIPGRKPMASKSVQLRLIVDGSDYTAQFRPDGKGEFQTAATGKLPAPGDDQVSIQCYHGPPDAEHWIRFDDFRISKLPE